MALEPEYQSRLMALYAWRKSFALSNTSVSVAPGFAQQDMDFADAITAALAGALAEVYESAAALVEWDAARVEMETELAVLLGVSAIVEGSRYPRTGLQNKVGSLWTNPHSLKMYLCSSTQYTNLVFLPESFGWVDPASPVWDESGDPFDVIHTSVNSDFQATYRCVGAESDLWVLPGVTTTSVIAQLTRRYTTRMDYVRTIAGIVPKSDSSSGDAGGCWIDYGDDFWWVDTDGYYLPAFSNQPYISARRDTETGKAYSTMEFGFGLVVACPDRLMKGDSLTIRISQVDTERPYQVGDEAIIQTVAAGPAWLAGGVDGTDVQTWRVAGAVSGALPDYIVPTDGTAAPLYTAAGVGLQLALGGIAFVLGDKFSLAMEAGQWRWRSGAGAWSALADIAPDGQALLAEGLVAHFEPGAAPSFVPGDTYLFEVHQPWAVSHVQDAQATAWGWAGDGGALVMDLGSTQPLGGVALARYQLPNSANVALELSQDGMVWGAPLALDVGRAVCVRLFPLALSARFLRLSVSGAPGGSIGWLWCGEPLATEHHASTCQRRRRWAATRGAGLNAPALYAGAGDGWQVGWESALLDADADALVQLVDWAQQHDEPIIFVPHHLHPGDAALVRCAADALDVSDVHEYQPDNPAHRLLSATLEMEPVYA